MHATEIVLPGLVEPTGLLVRERELPAPGAGQALVRVEASGVSFAEQQMRRGKYYDQPRFPFVPGYDLVGRVERVGPGVDGALVGARVAAVTKTGGWATAALLDAGDLVPVPDGVDPADAETVVVNGVTAWQMLHRMARVPRGGTILVLGANGGVGSTLVQLARQSGIRVVGTASPRHHDAVRALGSEPIDYRDPQLYAKARALAPEGYDGVFDHVGGAAVIESWRLVRRGGALVSYGSAATRDAAGSARWPVLALFGRLLWWNLTPNGRRAGFYNLWAGRRRKAAFQARLRADLTNVFALLATGALRAQVAARVPLTSAAEAVALAESGTVTGKVVLIP